MFPKLEIWNEILLLGSCNKNYLFLFSRNERLCFVKQKEKEIKAKAKANKETKTKEKIQTERINKKGESLLSTFSL